MKNIKWTHKIHKTDKNTEKMSSKGNWLYFLISTQQPTLLSIGCFWQYFVPMSIVLHVNLTSFFKFSSVSSITNLSGTISMALLCGCYMFSFLNLCAVWSFWWSKAKYNCTLYLLGSFFIIKFPLTKMNIVLRRTTTERLIKRWQSVFTQFSRYILPMICNVIARSFFSSKKF